MNTDFAHTILEQLGGSRVLNTMLGIKSLTASEATKTLTIKFKAAGREGVNTIVIRLDPSDTYTLQFWKCRGLQTKMLMECSDVYSEELISTCEEVTGLAFRVPRVVFPR